MINHYSGGLVTIKNLSDAADTQTLLQLLAQHQNEYDAKDAGTTFRFLTSSLAFAGKESILTGSDRMKQRPIRLLVDALRKLGCTIHYLEKEGYPPLKFGAFRWSGERSISIDATISSQYISSLMMAAPDLPEGLTIELKDTVASLPYLEMTWMLMQRCGIQGTFENERFEVVHQPYIKGTISVESDWSAASYWYGMMALAKKDCTLFLSGLRADSLQGDSAVRRIAERWGVGSSFSEQGVLLSKNAKTPNPSILELDFLSFPDLGRTSIVLCALSGTEARFSGLQSLAIKETNRLLAIKTELEKIGIEMAINEREGTCNIPGNQALKIEQPTFNTYEDHRMAMALSLVSMVAQAPIQISEPDVVKKSYPGFWKALAEGGFAVCT